MTLVRDAFVACPVTTRLQVDVNCERREASAQRSQCHLLESATFHHRPCGPMHPGPTGTILLAPSAPAPERAHQTAELQVAHGPMVPPAR